MQDTQDKETRKMTNERSTKEQKMAVRSRFSAPVHTGPGAKPASYTVGTGCLSR
jgi:hypothetical protein